MFRTASALAATIGMVGVALGRGVHGAIPLHLVFESTNLRAVQPNKPLHCRLALTVSLDSHQRINVY